ncbi:hypothetical protein JHK82_031622 [Glycine max]|uniref:DUF4283 domain-containing protein n=1 Tax=Glycine max TaxID=3847 RepID=A0A0R0HI74_SOYBN|nr:hypothetical protein JHK85_032275 [Glycine max]KAG5124885.1 hypothetical protein JHK82_031622 [Glycine max]
MANPSVPLYYTGAMGNDGSGKDPPDNEGDFPPPPAKVSFQDKTTVNKKLAKIEYEDGKPLKLKVVIADLVFERLCTPWQDALVVKLLGKKINFILIKERLTKIWKLKAVFYLMDFGNNFYMAKFDMEEDRTKIIGEGSWMIIDHYLIIQTLSFSFVFPKATIDKPWYSNILDVRRGQFTGVYVEVDLNKLVIGKVWLPDHWYKVEYEGLLI